MKKSCFTVFIFQRTRNYYHNQLEGFKVDQQNFYEREIIVVQKPSAREVDELFLSFISSTRKVVLLSFRYIYSNRKNNNMQSLS